MDQQFEKIKAIESKIQKLIELNKNLAEEKAMYEDENRQLTEQVKSLTEKIDMQGQQLTQLEETNKSLNLATNETTETKEENKFLKSRIDEYVQEIDKCLALLDK